METLGAKTPLSLLCFEENQPTLSSYRNYPLARNEPAGHDFQLLLADLSPDFVFERDCTAKEFRISDRFKNFILIPTDFMPRSLSRCSCITYRSNDFLPNTRLFPRDPPIRAILSFCWRTNGTRMHRITPCNKIQLFFPSFSIFTHHLSLTLELSVSLGIWDNHGWGWWTSKTALLTSCISCRFIAVFCCV